MFKTNCSSIEHWYKKLGDGFNKKRGKNKHACLMFDNELVAYSKQIKLCPRDIMFPIKQEHIYYYNPLCFIYSGLMLDNIIMNLFTDFTK